MRALGRFDVRFGSIADIASGPQHVRFTPKADIDQHGRDVRFVCSNGWPLFFIVIYKSLAALRQLPHCRARIPR
jgi:hypothetical protein